MLSPGFPFSFSGPTGNIRLTGSDCNSLLQISRAVRHQRWKGKSVNWPKLVVEYGQAAALTAILLSVLGLIAVFRRSRRSLPRGWVSWVGSIVAIFVIYQSVGFLRWSQAKVNPLKPVFREANQTAPDFTFKLLADDPPAG